MPIYNDVVAAANETITKILARGGAATAQRQINVSTGGGNTASVSWGYGAVDVNLPTLPLDAVLSRAEADQIVGYIAHECCHVMHTARHVWDAAVADGARVRYWVNAMEDVRIEAAELALGHFPNLRNMLAAITDKHHFEALEVARTRGETIGAVGVADAPYCALVLGRVANGYAVPTAHALAAGMGSACGVLVGHALRSLGACQDTMDVLTLARELLAMEGALRDAPPPAPPPGDQPDGDQGDQGDGGQGDQGDQDAPQGDQDAPQGGDGGQGDQGDQDAPQGGQDAPQGGQGDGGQGDGGQGDGGQGDGGQSGQGDGGQDGQGDAPQGDQGAGGEGGDQGGDGAGGTGHGTPGATRDDLDAPGAVDPDGDGLADVVAKIAAREKVNPEANKASGVTKLAGARSTVQDHNLDGGVPAPVAKRTATKIRNRLPASGMLAGQIARLLVSDEVHRTTHHETSGRLDRRSICRMGTGAMDVFSRRSDTPGINTAVLVLIDGSGSMRALVDRHNNRSTMAQTAALHIAEAAEAANGKIAIASFVTPTRYGSSNGALLRVVKPWDVSMRDRVASLASVKPESFTPLSPAIIAGATMMQEVTATRRIMLVLTDGDCDYGNDAVTAACALAATMGVEVVGIGMDARAVAQAFPPRYSVNVESLDQLARTGLGVLVAMLEDASPGNAD